MSFRAGHYIAKGVTLGINYSVSRETVNYLSGFFLGDKKATNLIYRYGLLSMTNSVAKQNDATYGF